jgi:glycosyltransferase involved in cell wall biosynthesis
MSPSLPAKVLIAGGKPAGGIASFAEALRCGFTELRIPVEVAAPLDILRRIGELRDPRVLKILSLTALFAAPIARRAICLAHGFPCVEDQGWIRALAILASYRSATASRGAQLVEVSEYAAVHLRKVFGIRVDAVIHNPVNPIFLDPPAEAGERNAITYVGRLHSAKHVDRLLPAIRNVLDENPELRAWIIGDGPMRADLERIAAGDQRIEFLGALAPCDVRKWLRRTKVFVSACPTEALGIAYLEALSQGCAVAMPASGGGLEIAPDRVGERIHLFRASAQPSEVVAALSIAVTMAPHSMSVASYAPRAIAQSYLAVDMHFSSDGTFAGDKRKTSRGGAKGWRPTHEVGR